MYAFSDHAQMIILPIAELRLLSKIFFGDIKPADITDFSVYHRNLPVIPFLHVKKEKRKTGTIHHMDMDAGIFHRLKRRFFNCPAARPIQKQINGYASLGFCFQQGIHIVADLIIFHNKKHHVNRRGGLANIIHHPLNEISAAVDQFDVTLLF